MAHAINRPDRNALYRILNKHCYDPAGILLRLAWLEGLTREEIATLKWDNVSLETQELHLKDRTIPLDDEVVQCLKYRFSVFAHCSPYVVVSDRFRKAIHPVYISKLARDAMDEEKSLANIRLVDLRNDFIIRQLESHDWAYVARISGFNVTSFQAKFSPYIKVKTLTQRELQGDDEYRIWQVLQKEKDTVEGLALSMRWYMNVQLNEMVGLTWDQVDFEHDSLHLPDRDVVISSPVRKSLLALFQQRRENEDPHVLLKKNARTPMDVSYLSKSVRTIMLRNGVDDIQFRDVCRETEKSVDKAKLLELAEQKPGFSRGDALEATGLTKAALYRRLRELVDKHKLVKVGMMYYLPGAVVPVEEQDRVIRDYLQEHGTATMADLRFLLRIERRQCGRVLKKMVEEGKLVREGDLFRLPAAENNDLQHKETVTF